MSTVEEMVAPGASAEAIRHHYDAGNDFFRLWLDPTLSYSCALWDDSVPDDGLEAAQLRKIDYHLQEARLEGARRMLDIGCGWGAVLRRSVDAWGVGRSIGLTLSGAQADDLARVADPRIEVQVKHWAEYDPDEPFDGIISIGAFEHFARLSDTPDTKVENYRRFFSRCHQWLAPDGRLSLQTIGWGDVPRGQMPSDLFIAQEIFPESDLPRLADIALASESTFEIERVRIDREHYARTARCWFDALRRNRERALAVVGEETVRRYERYLRMFAYGFQLGSLTLYRVTLRRLSGARHAR